MTKLSSFLQNTSNLFNCCTNEGKKNIQKKISPQTYFVSTQKKKKRKLKEIMPYVTDPYATDVLRLLYERIQWNWILMIPFIIPIDNQK